MSSDNCILYDKSRKINGIPLKYSAEYYKKKSKINYTLYKNGLDSLSFVGIQCKYKNKLYHSFLHQLFHVLSM